MELRDMDGRILVAYGCGAGSTEKARTDQIIVNGNQMLLQIAKIITPT